MKRFLACICFFLIFNLIGVAVFFFIWGRGTRFDMPASSLVVNPRDSKDEGNPSVPSLVIRDAKPALELNALFEQKDGWIGGDGAHSVKLSPQRTLWLFSDSWMGSIRNGKRVDATIVNNVVALQEGHGAQAKMRFIASHGPDGKPQAFLTPNDRRGWFWLQAGAIVNRKLYMFLTQLEKTSDPGVFGFRQIGLWLAVIDNVQDDPTAWHAEQIKLPCTIFEPKRELTFGAALLENGDHLYIYGTDEDVNEEGRDRYLIVARAQKTTIENVTTWEFFREGQWQADFAASGRLVKEMASDCSVTFMSKIKQYVLVYTERGLSARILARTALEPRGPWSPPAIMYECPEMGQDKRIFCYNGKAHASMSGGDEMVVSYVANSFDFWHLAADAQLYWPRFVRIGLKARE
ncbi:MAG: DUF4185 domain-containing protein [Thermoguttaceae bacterium]|jgi:hypothetical protein